ncbi:hypothetical protein EVAR_71792_1 [Eumeta japonica]|uniref:Uncharacterized protein n=1 Tax=Eumeta variegata TaxID=151549 RepID=A0A4C1SJH3_EUMVA|nr:hypothetical protein EVAR_71792_1 [Eumeta japonica]
MAFKIASIPVLFPIDICVFSLQDSKYATTLHMKSNGARHFEVFKTNNGVYELIADIASPNGIAMDCTDFNNKGYVAIALNYTERMQSANEGSPIYEISGRHVRAIQYFAAAHLTSMYLRNADAEKFILLIACTDQDIKIYNFNDWKFEESKVQFTDGALGQGGQTCVSIRKMKSYLIIATIIWPIVRPTYILPILNKNSMLTL